MNQFKAYEEKLNRNPTALSIAKDFDFILNNIWSTYSFAKGKTRWNEVCKNIENPFYRKIMTEIEHVELGHGREQSLMATKSEMIKYLEYLLNG